MEKIIVENFEIFVNGETIGIALDIDEGEVSDAAFLYDGGNCAILIRNKTKAFWLPEILPDIREMLLASPIVLMIEKAGDEILNAYEVEVEYFEIPYPDHFEDKMIEMVEKLEVEFGKEKLEELIRNVEA